MRNDSIGGMAPPSLKILETLAKARGFSRIGVAPAAAAPHDADFGRWLAEGRHGAMKYLERSRDLRRDPRNLLPGARSVIVLAHPYGSGDPRSRDGVRTARYALAQDYHRTLRAKCESLVAEWKETTGAFLNHRVCVDSAPLAERDFAVAAGIGWVGKNAMVLNEEGSYFLLCEILVDAELPPSAPVFDQCGSCTRCLDACPTDAFVQPGMLDATRCVSYWTIEQRNAIPDHIVSRMGGWIFGCDICQEVCPYNAAIETESFPRQPPGLEETLDMKSSAWRRRYRDTPLSRAGLSGMRRNAAAAADSLSRRELLPRLRELAASAHAVVAAQSAAAVARLSAARR